MAKVAPAEDDEVNKLSVDGGKDSDGKTVNGKDVTKRTTDKAKGLFTFANTEAIKEKVRSQKLSGVKAVYNVHDRYWSEGFIQKIAKSPYFENTTLGVIVVNALWIWIDTDYNKGDTLLDADTIFVFMDSCFFGYFSLELIIRFLAFRRKSDCLRDAWFVFDSTLVTLYAFDPFTIALIAYTQGGEGMNLPTAVLRLFRLARLSRLVRMLRSLPELMIMIKGMLTAAASVGYTLGLLLVITYVFSIALVNTKSIEGDPCWGFVEENDPDTPEGEAELQDFFLGAPGILEALPIKECTCTAYFFPSVPEGMHNLIVYATFLDNLSFFITNVKVDSTFSFILCWVYISLASLTVMNMLIGVLCEVISAVAEEEKEGMMVEKVNDKFGDIVSQLDTNNDDQLSWDEFQKIMDYPEAIKALNDVNVDPESMIDMAEDLFFEDGEPVALTFQEFMEMVLDLRGGQGATVKDIMSLGKRFSQKFVNQKARMDHIEKKMDNAAAKMEGVLKHYSLEIPKLHSTTNFQGDDDEFCEGDVFDEGTGDVSGTLKSIKKDTKSDDKLRLAGQEESSKLAPMNA